MALLATLSDNFDDNSTGAAWTTFTASSGTVAETGGQVVVTPANSTAGSTAGYRSASNYDLTSSWGQVQVVQAADTTNCFTEFILKADASNNVAMSVSGGNLQAYQTVATVFSSLKTVAYNSTTHKWWRIREVNGKTYWDYSSDSITWTNFFNKANPITMTSLQVQLDGYENVSTASPGQAKFDNFNILTSGTSMANLTDAMSGATISSGKWTTYTASSGAITQNEELIYALAATTSGSWSGVCSVLQYDLTGNTISCQINAGTGGNTYLDLTLSIEQIGGNDNFISIGIDAGLNKLQAFKELGGSGTVLANITYNAATMEWVRIRESGGTIYYEYASDRAAGNWTTLYSGANPLPSITNLYVILDDFEYNNGSTPPVHRLDNFNMPMVAHGTNATTRYIQVGNGMGRSESAT